MSRFSRRPKPSQQVSQPIEGCRRKRMFPGMPSQPAQSLTPIAVLLWYWVNKHQPSPEGEQKPHRGTRVKGACIMLDPAMFCGVTAKVILIQVADRNLTHRAGSVRSRSKGLDTTA